MLRTALCATLAIGVVAAPANAGLSAREAKAEYVSAGGVAGIITGDTDINGTHLGTARIYPRRAERYVAMSLTDATGLPVAFEVAQDLDDDGREETSYGAYCGKMPEIKLKAARLPVTVFILTGQCGTGVSAPTKGVVTATLR